MAGVTELAPLVGVLTACAALGVPRASFYRRQHPVLGPRKRPSSPRALTPAERATVLGCLHEERFQDRAPAAVYATLLDEGHYHCSIRTIYRLLAQEGETRERRDQLTHPPYQKPELLATAPNQLWSWDITKLLGPVKWTYFYYYCVKNKHFVVELFSWDHASLRQAPNRGASRHISRAWPTPRGMPTGTHR